MSIHIGAEKGQIAERVLFPGDPRRAEYIAETFLTDVFKYNDIRNMSGFTGVAPDGRHVSVQGLVSAQGSGMGMPSINIYATELFRDYDVQEIIRVGTCGSLQTHIPLKSIILAQASCSNSNINKRRFRNMDYAPIADFGLLMKAYQEVLRQGSTVVGHIGNILASDTFYDPDPEEWKLWAKYNVLAVEMETAELYTLAAEYGRKALTILTVSDCLPTKGTPEDKELTPHERESSLDEMVKIALSI